MRRQKSLKKMKKTKQKTKKVEIKYTVNTPWAEMPKEYWNRFG